MITEEMRQAFYSKADIQQTGTVLNLDEALTAALALLPGDPWGWEVDGSYPLCGEDIITKSKEVRDSWAKNDGITIRPLYTSPAPHSAGRDALLEEARRVLTEARSALDGEPEYHHSGMGCGLEDRNIHDRYDAMHHGWECALERVYGEHVIPAREAIDAFLVKLEGSSHAED